MARQHRPKVEPKPAADPLVTQARAWLKQKAAAEALMHEWQRLETALYRKHGAMSAREAVRRGYAEGRKMQALEARFRVARRKLDRNTGRLARSRAATAAGALAQIEMGLALQHPLDGEAFSGMLIQGGVARLRELM